MFEFSVEGVLLGEIMFQRSKQVFGAIDGFTALPADQVMVVSFFGVMIDEVVAGFTFDNATQVFKKFQCPVYCGFVYSGHLALDISDNILCYQM
jgi:hypothetical protein